MKTIIFIMLLLVMTACCKDFYPIPVRVEISKDNKPLSNLNIQPVFTYLDNDGKELELPTSSPTLPEVSSFCICQTNDLIKLSFRPVTLYIRYNTLPETDTIVFLLDYSCANKNSNCSCGEVVLKYMNYNSVLIPDQTIRK